MVPKRKPALFCKKLRFRAVLFRMVPKLGDTAVGADACFRAVLFRMVPKLRFEPL